MEEKMYGLVIEPNGIARSVEFPKENKLGWYYETIGCDCIDIVNAYGVDEVAKMYSLEALLGKFCIVVDDEGLLKAKPQVNVIASILYGADSHGQALFGTVLVAKNEETEDGIETVGLDAGEMAMLQAAINSLIDRHNEMVKEAKKDG